MLYPIVMTYSPRVVDVELRQALEAMGGVLLEGARACGKTSTGSHQAASVVRLDADPQAARLVELSPGLVLEGQTPRLIDEWQLAPAIWNAARHEVDQRQRRGQFIFSGCSVPRDDVTRHSGAGRFARLKMRPMSLFEWGSSTGDVSFADLMSGHGSVAATASVTYEELARLAVIGGWPALLGATTEQAQFYNRAYLEELAHSDVQRVTGVGHAPERVRRLLAALARSVASEVRLTTLRADISGDGGDLGIDAVRTYLDALTRVFAIEGQAAWSVALRSKSRLREQPKMHLVDPALAAAALNAGPDRLARDPEYFGQVFESMAVRDLRVYAQPLTGQVFHYRDNTGLKIDAIVECMNGTWAAFEVKLGGGRVEDAERNLLKLRDERVDLDRVGTPAALVVLTGTQYAYTLPSGVHVVPLATLGP